MKIILKKIFVFLLILIIGIMIIRLIFAYDMEKDTNTAGVLLTINDITITEQEFAQRQVLYKAFGQEKTEQELLDRLIEEKSIISQAIALGVEPTESEVTEQLKENYELVKNNQDFQDMYSQVFANLNMTCEEYFSTYESYFTYYKLCLENLTAELYLQAEDKNLNKFDYAEKQRKEWKKNSVITDKTTNLQVNLMY